MKYRHKEGDRLLFSLKDRSKLFLFDNKYLHQCNNQKEKYPWLFKIRLTKYIRKQPFHLLFMDQQKCIFEDNNYINLSIEFYSDGEWVWSADLIHYTEKHYFRWPKEFI